MLIITCIGTLPIEVDMNQIPNFDTQEEEPPPPLPARSANLCIDAPSHTLQPLDPGSQDPEPLRPALPPSLRNAEIQAPALPPKPAHMMLVGKTCI